jgi:tubulin alpha
LNNSNITDYLFQNDIITDILQKKLKINFPKQKNINRFIAQVISSITSPIRYEDNCPMLQYFNWLTPFPKLHFLLSSYSPICHPELVQYENFSVRSITDGTFHSNSMTANCPSNYNKLISSLLIYRGGRLFSDEVQEALNYVGNKYNIIFNDCKNFGFYSYIVPEPPIFIQDFPKLENSVCRITNSPCIKKIFLGIKNKIDKENIVNKYFEEGLEKEEVNEAREDLDNLINNYKDIKFWDLNDSSSEEN